MMNNNQLEKVFLKQLPWLSLVLFCLTYALVGWHLSAYHIVWFIGVFIATATIAISWTSSPWLEGVLGYLPQVLIVVLLVSILLTLAVTSSIILTLILIPLLATFLAWQELRSLGLGKNRVFWTLIIVASISLGIGEFVDISLVPSGRY